MRLMHPEDAQEAVVEATAPLHARIAELEADLADAQEQLAEFEPMRPVLNQLRLIAGGNPVATSMETPKVLSLNGMTLWGAGSGAELLLLRLLWVVQDLTTRRKT